MGLEEKLKNGEIDGIVDETCIWNTDLWRELYAMKCESQRGSKFDVYEVNPYKDEPDKKIGYGCDKVAYEHLGKGKSRVIGAIRFVPKR